MVPSRSNFVLRRQCVADYNMDVKTICNDVAQILSTIRLKVVIMDMEGVKSEVTVEGI